jgi:beta-lactamase regulating signal transducer with metallopeptidase domain
MPSITIVDVPSHTDAAPAIHTAVHVEKSTPPIAQSIAKPDSQPPLTIATTASPVRTSTWLDSLGWQFWLAAAWLLGAVVMAARYAKAGVNVRRLLLSSRRVLQQEWLNLEQHVTSSFGIQRPVVLLTSEQVDVPITAGVVYPRVVLPAAAVEWSPARRHAVLTHELAHVKRFDAATQWIAFAATAVCWFNPFVWYAVRQMRFERERACDDFVLSTGARASDYATDLLAIVSSFGNSEKYHVALAMARRSQFEGRLLALLDPALERKFLSRTALAVVATAAIAVVLPVAAAHLAQPAAESMPLPIATTQAAAPQNGSAPANPTSTATEVAAPAPAAAPSAQPQTAAAAPHAYDVNASYRLSGNDSQAAPAPAATPQPESTPRALAAPAPAAPARAGSTPASAPPQPFKSGEFAVCNKANQRNISRHEDDGSKRWEVTIRGDNCSVDMRAEGDVQFKPDFSGVESISSGGYLTVKTKINGETNELEVRPGSNGPAYTYTRNGSRMQMDAAGQKWFSDFLAEVDRANAFAVDTRLPQLLAQGGPARVLQETAQMSDYARSVYIAALLKRTQLSPTDAREVIRQAGDTGSDYYASEMLMAVADRYSLDDASIGPAFVAAIDHVKSDYYHSQVLMRFLDKAPSVSKQQGDVLLRSASHIGSDYYVTQVLQRMAEKRLIPSNGWSTYLDAAQKVNSDYYRSQVLSTLMRSYSGDPSVVERSILAAEKIGSDYYKLEVLRSAKEHFKIQGSLFDAYKKVANTIQSETYRKQAMEGFQSAGLL